MNVLLRSEMFLDVKGYIFFNPEELPEGRGDVDGMMEDS